MEDSDLPMPTLEEILICNQYTSFEEVCLGYTKVYFFIHILSQNFVSTHRNFTSCRWISCGREPYVIKNAGRFSVWYMLRSYPTKQQTKCYNHSLTLFRPNVVVKFLPYNSLMMLAYNNNLTVVPSALITNLNTSVYRITKVFAASPILYTSECTQLYWDLPLLQGACASHCN